MLSNPLQRFSPYQNLAPPGLIPTDDNTIPSHPHPSIHPPPPPTTLTHHNGIDSLGYDHHQHQHQHQHQQHQQQHQQHHAAQLGIPHQIHQSMGGAGDLPSPHMMPSTTAVAATATSRSLVGTAAKQHQHQQHHQRYQPYAQVGRMPGTPSATATAAAAAAAGQVRRRISRACDQCNQLRTKCNGQHPCAHCIEFGLGCEYARERKKRGKASRKDLAARAAAAAGARPGSGGKSKDTTPTAITTDAKHQHHLNDNSNMDADPLDNSQPLDLNSGFASAYDRQGMGSYVGHTQADISAAAAAAAYPDLSEAYPMQQSPPGYNNSGNSSSSSGINNNNNNNNNGSSSSGRGFPMIGSSPMGAGPGYVGMGGAAPSPGWASLGFATATSPAHFQQVATPAASAAVPGYGTQLRYPVLEPLLPYLGSVMPISLACDLVDEYFSSSSSAQMHPMSPYVLGFVFRKRAFVHPTRPRRCRPALLASMLWVAAQTSDAPLLTSMPSARAKMCQRLLELTVRLLNPLIHTPASGSIHAGGGASPVGGAGGSSSPQAGAVPLDGLGVALPGSLSMDAYVLSGESGPFGAAGTIDDVAAYIHIATVVAASEYKGASLRWWNAAWSLARELKLGRELPPSSRSSGQQYHGGGSIDPGDDDHCLDEHDVYRNNNANIVTDEEREERRRIWWLVYIVDRHLALCYNRPLFLLDAECEGLQRPVDDLAWQRGEFGSGAGAGENVSGSGGGNHDEQTRGTHQFECRGHSIFGYFLPLMIIQGEIVDLHHARNHPRFGVGFRSAGEWDSQVAEIESHLEMYGRSLRAFERQQSVPECSASVFSLSPPALSVTETGRGGGGGGGKEDGTAETAAAADADTPSARTAATTPSTAGQGHHHHHHQRLTESDIQTRIVVAYGTHVMHVLHILLAGKWDPIDLLDDEDLWISTRGFIDATSHAVSAADAIGHILEFDSGLEFMPFFFGVYLLQGSFLLLLIADKLQHEASRNVVRACETIVRAHEACVVTLNTEYQLDEVTDNN
ncbi:hypothetical protein GMORB2_4097 [Geosmithia morbida]|uniref:Zn(2)-C6 fungal-type domain-containing protein n=1 Tax=Geosmithia morbida TaxID=1094350 RepID=A0A9P4Z0N7_9HYPO|nr:uncharacterized protein GMORB2_4097 [Geosmithia morbida]KAF4125257.1 hypothetical protein GMORB2_4097 [Geosmithia morbida]